jgi:hypothetical protein
MDSQGRRHHAAFPRTRRGRHRAVKHLPWVAVLVVLAASAALTVVTETSRAPSADALGKIKCAVPTGFAAVDPIVFHDQPAPTGHLHTFFGNVTLLRMGNPNTADYSDMVGGATNCLNPSDTAAYWMPTLQYVSGPNAGKPVPIMSFRAYYRSFDHERSGAGQAYPPDTRLVAGDGKASTLQSTKTIDWTCGHLSGIGPSPTIPDCTGQPGVPGRTLTAHVDFPSCWDGKLAPHNVTGDTRDNAHFAYTVKGTCPPGFPIKTVELRTTFVFDYQGNGRDIMLSSDRMVPGAKPGQTLHADFWNTWVQKGFEQMVAHCVTNGEHPTFPRECS